MYNEIKEMVAMITAILDFIKQTRKDVQEGNQSVKNNISKFDEEWDKWNSTKKKHWNPPKK